MVELTWSKVYKKQVENWDLSGYVHFRIDINAVLIQWFRENPDWTLFEVGCGTGKTLEFLCERGVVPAEYHGLDITREFIDICMDRFPMSDSSLPLVTFQVVSLFECQSPENNYDVVVSVDVIQHLENWQEAVERLVYFARKYVLLCVRTTPGRTFDESDDCIKLRINQNELRDECRKYGKVEWFKTRTFGGSKVKTIYIIDLT